MNTYTDTEPPLRNQITAWLSPGAMIPTPRETLRADQWLERERERFAAQGRQTAIHRIVIRCGKTYVTNCGKSRVAESSQTLLCLARK